MKTKILKNKDSQKAHKVESGGQRAEGMKNNFRNEWKAKSMRQMIIKRTSANGF